MLLTLVAAASLAIWWFAFGSEGAARGSSGALVDPALGSRAGGADTDEPSPRSDWPPAVSRRPASDSEPPVAEAPSRCGPVEVAVSERAANGWAPRAGCGVVLETSMDAFGATPGAVVERAETDTEGIARFTGEAPRPPGSTLVVRLDEDGLIPRWRRVEGGEARLTAESGLSVRGRVVDAEGAPRSGRVTFLHRVDTRSGPQLRGRESAWSGHDGGFMLAFPTSRLEPGERVLEGMVVARVDGVGTGVVEGLEWDVSRPPDDLTVVVRGAGVLEGVVRDSDGRPCAALPIQARLEAEGSASGSELLLEADGATLVRGTTDANGRFRLTGLREGMFRIHTTHAAPFVPYGPAVALTNGPVATSTGPLELTFDEPHLIVRLEASDGTPWRHPIKVIDSHRQGEYVLREALDTTTLRVVPARTAHGRPVADSADPSCHLTASAPVDGLVRVSTRSHRELLVIATGGEGDERFAPQPVHVALPEPATRAEVTLRATTGLATGEVRFECEVERWPAPSFFPSPYPLDEAKRRPRVTRLGRMGPGSESYLAIEDPLSQVIIATPDDLAEPIRLPAGEYVARIGLRFDRASPFGGSSRHGGASTRFRVQPDHLEVVQLSAGTGGIIAIENQTDAIVGWLEATDGHGRRFDVTRIEPMKVHESVETRFTHAPAGATVQFLPLPAGHYRLSGKMRGRPIRRTLDIEDGVVTRVLIE